MSLKQKKAYGHDVFKVVFCEGHNGVLQKGAFQRVELSFTLQHRHADIRW